jgi:hypothetical protein
VSAQRAVRLVLAPLVAALVVYQAVQLVPALVQPRTVVGAAALLLQAETALPPALVAEVPQDQTEMAIPVQALRIHRRVADQAITGLAVLVGVRAAELAAVARNTTPRMAAVAAVAESMAAVL